MHACTTAHLHYGTPAQGKLQSRCHPTLIMQRQKSQSSRSAADGEQGVSPPDLLGPLNEVEAKNAPPKLYFRGDTDLLQRSRLRVSIVGARKASPEGLAQAAQLAQDLAKAGIIVVSGLAEGIDAAAHEAAIRAGGRTIAVLGGPVDAFFPPKNRRLQEEIQNHHLVISQFPAGYPILRQNFPQRNRVMALISDATVIVEAGETSGSISQGWEAIRLGRHLWLYESVGTNPAFEWSREMLKYGAEVIPDSRRLLRFLPIRRAWGRPTAARPVFA